MLGRQDVGVLDAFKIHRSWPAFKVLGFEGLAFTDIIVLPLGFVDF